MSLFMLMPVLLCVIINTLEVGSACTVYVEQSGTANCSCSPIGKSSTCENITLAFSIASRQNNSKVVISSGNYSLQSNITFLNLFNISLVGTNNVIIECGSEIGLTFLLVNTVSIQHIHFFGCGALHNSTSNDLSATSESFISFRAGLYFLYCRDINFTKIAVTNSSGTGMVLYNTVGNNTVQQSKFRNNFVRPEEVDHYPGGGGLSIEFSQCDPNYPSCTPPISSYVENSIYNFHDCLFEANNSTSTNFKWNYENFEGKVYHEQFNKGGGLSITFGGNASNNVFTLSLCYFVKNAARRGAGLFITFEQSAVHNKLLVLHSNFSSNLWYNEKSYTRSLSWASLGGGARVQFLFFMQSDTGLHNEVAFSTCNFTYNQAYQGGGVSLVATKERHAGKESTNSAIFVNCSFSYNQAHTGSALETSIHYPDTHDVLFTCNITNCTFAHNRMISDKNRVVGMGTLYINGITTIINHFSIFNNNSYTAVVVSEAELLVLPFTQVEFFQNQGFNGGALALLNGAYLIISERTTLNFTKNTALNKGGAIYAAMYGESYYMYSESCFIGYDLPFFHPDNWNVSITFSENSANSKANAIYAVSIVSCVWAISPNSSIQDDLNKVFCWDGWQYMDPNRQTNCTSQVTVAPSQFEHSPNCTQPTLSLIPGEHQSLCLRLYDDRGVDVTTQAVLAGAIKNTTNAMVDPESQYISDDHITIQGVPKLNAILTIETIDPRVVRTDLNVTLTQCPPGYILSNTAAPKAKICIFGDGFGGHVQQGGNYNAFLKRGFCMSDHLNMTVVAGCPYSWMIAADSHLQENKGILLPRNYSQLTEKLCGPLNRNGLLCGKCKDKYTVAINSYWFTCVPCKNSYKNWVKYILVVFLPITLFFVVIVFFNISAASAPAITFVCFAQAMTLPNNVIEGRYTAGQNVTVGTNFYIVPYSIWNFDFFKTVITPFCLFEGMTAQQVFAFQYLTALYPLLLVLLTYILIKLYDCNTRIIVILWKPFRLCFSRLRRHWKLQSSIIDAFVTCLILSYSKFCTVSFSLLIPSNLYNDTGHLVGHKTYYNGSETFLSTEHFPYIMLAAIVLIFLVILPIFLLVLYPLRTFQVLLDRCKIAKVSINTFAESFNGPFRNGTDGRLDCRYFAAFYLLFRVIMNATALLSFQLPLKHFIEQLVVTVMIMIIAIFQPYKENWYNRLDVAIFSCMAMIIAASLLIELLPSLGNAVIIPLYALLWLPMVYMTLFVVHWVYQRSCRKFTLTSCKKAMLKCCASRKPPHLTPEKAQCVVDVLSIEGDDSFSQYSNYREQHSERWSDEGERLFQRDREYGAVD